MTEEEVLYQRMKVEPRCSPTNRVTSDPCFYRHSETSIRCQAVPISVFCNISFLHPFSSILFQLLDFSRASKKPRIEDSKIKPRTLSNLYIMKFTTFIQEKRLWEKFL